ncbi:MAG: hypothetical protein V4584_16795 [Verrucomicrobiota bacterium]
MKKFILQSIACCAALLPFTQVQAAGVPGKNYYNLAPGTKYSLKVTDVVSTVTGLDGQAKQVAVPAGIPKFKKGQTVKFTIGKKGELKGPGFSTKFLSADPTTSAYADKQVGTKLPDNAAVKTSLTTKKAVYTQLAFHKITGSGFSTKVHFVVYVLQ